MAARRLVLVVVAWLCSLGAGALFVAPVAQAEPPKLVSYGKFQEGAYPFGIAVDNSGLASSSDVYVAGLAGSNINKFDAAGKLISPPSPFGSGSEFYSGAAVSPANGDVYVLDAASQAIDNYDPSSGALVGSPFSVPGCANGAFGSLTWVQIASDSAGNVYVPCAPGNVVREYSPTGTLLKTLTGSGAGALNEPTGVAVDASGNVWVADTGKSRIEEFDPSGATTGEVKSEGVRAVALDASGDVFALVKNGVDLCGSYGSPCNHVVEYSSAGKQIADVGAGVIAPTFYEAFGEIETLAVNDANGRVYVTDAGNNVVWIYGPPTAPVVGREFAAEVGTSEAKLGALVNPGGGSTSYRFEYDTREYREGEGPHGVSVPFPEGSVGQGVTSRTVWASASGLAPGTTYHYRVIATNGLGTVVGADQTFTTETSAQAICPNEQFRGGFSAGLPDCRAYELVTPPNELSAQPDTNKAADFVSGGGVEGNFAASEGNRMSYMSAEVLPGSSSGGWEYVASRGSSGWSSESVLPLQSYTADRCSQAGKGSAVRTYAADLSMAVLFVGGAETFSEPGALSTGCGAAGVEVVNGEPLGVENLLLRDNSSATYQLINRAPQGVTPSSATFAGASPDLSHIVFTENAQLTANAPAAVNDLYEWTSGVLRLVTVLPDGSPVAGSFAAISAGGSHIFFTAGNNLYVRLNGSSTVQVDVSQAGGSGGGGQFRGASPDGSQVFFTDDASAGLTSDTAPGSGTNLYRYAAGQLTDLAPGSHAEVERVSGVSEDGSYAYFVAHGSLAAGATQSQPNLYLWHGGTITFIATLAPADEGARVSPNGVFLAFSSTKSLTGYDNKDASTGFFDPEIFLYSAASNRLVCASCNPSGEPPVMGSGLSVFGEEQGGATIAGSPHLLSDNGRLFFETREALLPLDTNGQLDVYEYEDGQLHLISAGTSASRSVFLDASEDGNNVFFLTSQKLISQDTNAEALSIYDARVDGGFPEVASPPACTTADACRTPVSPQPSLYGAPSSQTFSGAGNLTPPAEAKSKKKAKPKRKKAKKKVCRRGKHKHARCATRARRTRSKAKSYKGGK